MTILLIGHNNFSEANNTQNYIIQYLEKVYKERVEDLKSRGLISENYSNNDTILEFLSCDFRHSTFGSLCARVKTYHNIQYAKKYEKSNYTYMTRRLRGILQDEEYAMVIVFNDKDNRKNRENKMVVELARPS